MIEYENQCVGCPPEMGCLGSSCPNRRVPIMTCDKCGEQVDALYWHDGAQYCADCVLTELERVKLDDE